EPWASCRSAATESVERPRTAEMFTGTSKTGARSPALFSSSSPRGSAAAASSGANSSSLRSSSSAMGSAFASGDQGFGVQALGGERRLQGLVHALGGGGGVEGDLAVTEIEHEGVAGEALLGLHL